MQWWKYWQWSALDKISIQLYLCNIYYDINCLEAFYGEPEYDPWALLSISDIIKY